MTSESDAKLIRGVVSNNPSSIANAVWEDKIIKEFLLCKLEKSIKEEGRDLCSRNKPSLLTDSKADSIILQKDSVIISELKQRAPTLKRVLRSASQGKVVRGKERDNRISRAITMVTSILMRCRNPSMPAMAYRISVLLWHSGAEKQVKCT